MSKRLYVGNLPYNVNDEALKAAFAEFGATEATIPMDGDRSKGFGFVEVADDQMEAAIVAMNGKEFNGRTLTVNEARPRTERPRGNYDRGPRNNSYGSSY